MTRISCDYTKPVFGLVYSTDPEPVELNEEEWSCATGRYISRTLVSRMGGAMVASSGVDYSGGTFQPLVQLLISLPLEAGIG